MTADDFAYDAWNDDGQRPATDNVLAVMSIVVGTLGLFTSCGGLCGFFGLCFAVWPPLVALILGGLGLSRASSLDGAGAGAAKIGVGLALLGWLATAALFGLEIVGIVTMAALNQ